MTKKIKLSEIKLKSSVVELNQKQRKAAKGGYYQSPRTSNLKSSKNWIADTQVDIRIHNGHSEPENDYTP